MTRKEKRETLIQAVKDVSESAVEALRQDNQEAYLDVIVSLEELSASFVELSDNDKLDRIE